MLNKRRLVRWFLSWTDSWNEEVHEAIESIVHTEYARMFPNGAQDPQIVEQMRTFYYARMMNTAILLVAVSSLVVSLCALVVSAVALGH
ncbi:hypothetical protein [Paraburkholderia sp. BR10882]|uniref:hypothetical protein n=1 Tax=unclassified Paraburkholderia TaxID=2615204 RepID=UPI0034CDA5DB